MWPPARRGHRGLRPGGKVECGMWKVECGMRKVETGMRKEVCDELSRVECGSQN
jgi:uncharacterized cupin superfamily protein